MATISLPPFLSKLQAIASSSVKSVAGWNEDGTQFVVRDSAKFEEDYLKKYFKGTKATFIRQLHFYDFKKVDNSKAEWTFEHPKFLRDAPYLVYEIKRKTRTEVTGPASKNEVQALRSETVALRQTVTEMQSKIDTLFAHLEHVISVQNNLQGAAQPISSHRASSSQGDLEPAAFKKPRKALTEYWSDDEAGNEEKFGAAASLLPFEDTSHATFVGNKWKSEGAEHVMNSGSVDPGPEPSGNDSYGSKQQPTNHLEGNDPHNSGDFAFFDSECKPHVGTQGSTTSVRYPPQANEINPLTWASGSTHEAVEPPSTNQLKLLMPSNTVPEPKCSVSLCGVSNLVHLPNEVMGDFLQKFVLQARTLYLNNALMDRTNPNLRNLNHTAFRGDCPLKDLITHAPPQLCTLLLHVCANTQTNFWTCGPHKAVPPQSQGTFFLDRVLLFFSLDGPQVQILGSTFLWYLSTLMKVTIRSLSMDGYDLSLKPKASIFSQFSRYLQEDTRVCLYLADREIERLADRAFTGSNVDEKPLQNAKT